MARLQGLSVLVTRPAGRAEPLCAMIEAQGGRAVHLACIVIEPVRFDQHALSDHYDWLIFTSVNAVNGFAANARFPTGKIAAIGAATATALSKAGHRPELVPENGFTSEDLLASPELSEPAGQQILLITGEGGREHLEKQLRQGGAKVDRIAVYRRSRPEIDPRPALDRWLLRDHQKPRSPVLTVSSAEGLLNFIACCPQDYLDELGRTVVIVPSERVARRAISTERFGEVITASSAANQATLDALKRVKGADAP